MTIRAHRVQEFSDPDPIDQSFVSLDSNRTYNILQNPKKTDDCVFSSDNIEDSVELS